MKDLFQKLVDILGLKNSGGDDLEGENQEGNLQSSRSEVRSEAQVRTKTIYPRETEPQARFRFPLIPDEKAIPTTSAQPTTHSSQRARNYPAPRPQADENTSIETKTKTPEYKVKEATKPFQPSQFFSPVYGSKRPIENQERTLEDSKGLVQPTTATTTITSQEPSQEQSQSQKSELEMTTESTDLDTIASVNEQPVIPSLPIIDVEAIHFPSQQEQEQQLEQQLESPFEIKTAKVIAFPKREWVAPIPEPSESSIYLQEKEVEAATKLARERWNAQAEKQFEAEKLHKAEPEAEAEAEVYVPYEFPEFHYLKQEPALVNDDMESVHLQIEKLTNALENFNVSADVVGVVKGPTVTRFELQPAPGVKVNKFTNLIDDIKLALAAKDIRMEAPIPGRSAIGIEVPNDISSPVFIRSMLESEEFQTHESPLAVALGRDIGGQPIIGDLRKMPHGLIAGSTGSGKSVCINSILVSLLYKANPSDLRLILIDPKVVELAPYNHIPHLLTPVVTDPKQATAALKWAVEEMEKRYEKFAEMGVRDIGRYNTLAVQESQEKLPYILIIIDELADLMMVSPHEVEEAICRIAQKARACGIHLLVATQRPSVDVITGLIKANIPTRIAFSVSSQADSRTILDMGGAERLLGKGDMLYYPSGIAKPLRVQGNFVSDEEIEQVVEHVKSIQKVKYLINKEDLIRSSTMPGDTDDELFSEALLFTIEQGQASASSLQRKFRIGYNRAARLIDMMEGEGFITGQSGSKAREVLITLDEYHQIFS